MEKYRQKPADNEEPKQKIGLLKDETLNYYRRVSETLSNGFVNEDDKNLFLNNVVTQLCDEAIPVSQNQTASRIVELLISLCDQEQVVRLLSAFSTQWYTACTDRFASHVLQKLLLAAALLLFKSKKLNTNCKDHDGDQISENETGIKTVESLILELCDFIEENLGEMISHVYGSHIVRVLLEITGGVRVEEKLVRSKLSRGQNQGSGESFDCSKVTDSFWNKLLSLTEKIMNSQNLEALLTETLPSTVVQTVLLVLHQRNKDMCQEYCQRLLQVAGLISETDSADESLPAFVQNVCGSYLVEQLLALSSGTVLQEIVDKVFKGRTVKFAVDRQANFVLQRLLSSLSDQNQFTGLFRELSKHLEDILALEHLGVISRLAETCSRLCLCQDKFTKRLQKAFHCYKPKDRQKALVPLLASLSTYEVLYPTATQQEGDGEETSKTQDSEEQKFAFARVNLHGSVTAQHMLRFTNPSPVADSLLSLDAPQLVTLTCNPSGSHIVDTFFTSKTVTQNNRQHMIHKLKGSYMELACSKNGSRALQTIWDNCSLKQKVIVAEELSKQEAKLQGDQFGRFAHQNFAIYHFVHQQKDWRDLMGAKVKKRKLFEEIIQGAETGSTKKRKQMKKDNTSQLLLDETESSGFDIGDVFRKKTSFHGRGRGRGSWRNDRPPQRKPGPPNGRGRQRGMGHRKSNQFR